MNTDTPQIQVFPNAPAEALANASCGPCLPFATVSEVISTAEFYRRQGCGDTDEQALKEALEEALARNEQLEERGEELDGLAAELEAAEEALEASEQARDCGLFDRERAAGSACRRQAIEPCAECALFVADRVSARMLEEVTKLRNELAFVREERNRFLEEAQRAAKPPATNGRRKKSSRAADAPVLFESAMADASTANDVSAVEST